MAVEVSTLALEVRVEQVEKAVDSLQKLNRTAAESQGAADKLKGAYEGMGRVVGQITGLLGTLGVTLGFAKMVRDIGEMEQAQVRLQARVRSTGMAAGYTTTQLLEMAKRTSELSTYTDHAVMSAESILLSYTKIGHEVFPQALKATTDLAAGWGMDLSSAAITVGMAIQNPEQGLQRLRRAHIAVDPAVAENIKSWTKLGMTAKATAEILKIIESANQDMAQQLLNTLPGALQKLGQAFEEAGEAIGKAGVSDAIQEIAHTITDWINENPEQVYNVAQIMSSGLITLAHALNEVAKAIKEAKEWLDYLSSWAPSGATAKFLFGSEPFWNPGDLAKNAYELSKKLPGIPSGVAPGMGGEVLRYALSGTGPSVPLAGLGGVAPFNPMTEGYGSYEVHRALQDMYRDRLDMERQRAQKTGGGVMDENQRKTLANLQSEIQLTQQRNDLLAKTDPLMRANVLDTSEAGRQIAQMEAYQKAFNSTQNTTIANEAKHLEQLKEHQADLLAVAKRETDLASPYQKAQADLKEIDRLTRATGQSAEWAARQKNAALNSVMQAENQHLQQLRDEYQLTLLQAQQAGTPAAGMSAAQRQAQLQLKISQDQSAWLAGEGANYQMSDPYVKLKLASIEAADAQTDVNDQLKEAKSLLESSKTPFDKYNEAMANLETLAKKFPSILTPDAVHKLTEQYQETLAGITPEYKQMRQAVMDAGNALTSAFSNAIINGESLSDVLDGLVTDLQRIAMQALVLKPFEDWFAKLLNGIGPGGGGGSGGGLFDLFGLFGGSSSAGGINWASLGGANPGGAGLWDSLTTWLGGLSFFQHGTVAKRPTMGIFGEAGPEAVMPLVQTPRGLGVAAVGGNSGGGGYDRVIIHNYPDNQIDTKEKNNSAGGKDLEIMILDRVAKDIERGGRVYRALNRTTGTRIQPIRR